MIKKLTKSLKLKLAKIELLVFDVDGVLTDNTVLMGNGKTEYKRFSIADGMAVYMARRAGIPTAFISGRKSPATTARAKELGVTDVHQSPGLKKIPFEKLLKKYKLPNEQVSYMGDDVIDVTLMKLAGVSATVPHAPAYVKRYADIVTRHEAGFGAAREFVDMVLQAKGFDLIELTYK